ncbi:sensor histidine kinase [Nocardia carnea]|uniref:sensor histidine kinase n=1 Tax=Nocardia carnea TaxID=37328 RepID=UPI0024580712|nr:histidine kinase [Nocardia carnea]
MGRTAISDWAIAVGVAAVLVVAGLSAQPTVTTLEPWGYLLLAAGGSALAARRRAPLTVLAVTGLCALGYQAAGFDVPAVAFLVAVYTAVRAGHRVTAVAAAVALVAALPLAILVSVHDIGEAFTQARGALELAWLIAAGAAGEALRQAEQRADEAERTREETARRRADEERLHIARELHDSLTHQISVIKVQSEAAVHVARKRGEDVPDALLAIREAGREAARELRATLEALRDDGTSPPHGLTDVEQLVQRARATGLATTLTIEGRYRNLPAAVDRTGYRIVQESLTNIARHAAAESAWVRIDYQPDALVIHVDDDGRAAPGAGAPPRRGRGGGGRGGPRSARAPPPPRPRPPPRPVRPYYPRPPSHPRGAGPPPGRCSG